MSPRDRAEQVYETIRRHGLMERDEIVTLIERTIAKAMADVVRPLNVDNRTHQTVAGQTVPDGHYVKIST
jgi:hypothetical protein